MSQQFLLNNTVRLSTIIEHRSTSFDFVLPDAEITPRRHFILIIKPYHRDAILAMFRDLTLNQVPVIRSKIPSVKFLNKYFTSVNPISCGNAAYELQHIFVYNQSKRLLVFVTSTSKSVYIRLSGVQINLPDPHKLPPWRVCFNPINKHIVVELKYVRCDQS